jgi:hypothetical protein
MGKRASRLDYRALQKPRPSDDATPWVRHNHPWGIFRFRLNLCSAVHRAGQAEGHQNHRIVDRDLHTVCNILHQQAKRNREKVPAKGFY